MSYHELNLEERIAIRVGLVQKLSLREIARQLNARHPPSAGRFGATVMLMATTPPMVPTSTRRPVG